MSEPRRGSRSAATTCSISAWSCASVRQTLHGGAVFGSWQSFPGSASASRTAPPKVDAYAAGPLRSWYWPVSPNTLLVLWLAAATRVRNCATSAV